MKFRCIKCEQLCDTTTAADNLMVEDCRITLGDDQVFLFGSPLCLKYFVEMVETVLYPVGSETI